MANKVGGELRVGVLDTNELIVVHDNVLPDENGVGHIVFSKAQAMAFANLIWLTAQKLKD